MKYKQFNYRLYETHMLVFDRIKPGSKVLDIGCATGYFARELLKKNCQTTGVDSDSKALKIAGKYCHPIPADLESSHKLNINSKFDYVLLLDVIEHLRNRTDLLKNIKKWLKKTGILILSTPNISHVSIRLNLLLGRFEYSEWGIMDESHIHFYTPNSITVELQKLDYKVTLMLYSADFGQIPYFGRYLRHLPKSLQSKLTNLCPTLLGVQTILFCQA